MTPRKGNAIIQSVRLKYVRLARGDVLVRGLMVQAPEIRVTDRRGVPVATNQVIAAVVYRSNEPQRKDLFYGDRQISFSRVCHGLQMHPYMPERIVVRPVDCLIELGKS